MRLVSFYFFSEVGTLSYIDGIPSGDCMTKICEGKSKGYLDKPFQRCRRIQPQMSNVTRPVTRSPPFIEDEPPLRLKSSTVEGGMIYHVKLARNYNLKTSKTENYGRLNVLICVHCDV